MDFSIFFGRGVTFKDLVIASAQPVNLKRSLGIFQMYLFNAVIAADERDGVKGEIDLFRFEQRAVAVGEALLYIDLAKGQGDHGEFVPRADSDFSNLDWRVQTFVGFLDKIVDQLISVQISRSH